IEVYGGVPLIIRHDASVDGGNGDDTIEVSGVDRISIEGGNGNDSIVVENHPIDAAVAPEFPVDADGGFGEVSVDGGAGNDTIYLTGMEHSSILGGAGRDSIVGDDQHEVERWSAPQQGPAIDGTNDLIRGGDGNDTVDGRDGDDRIFGS